MDNRNLGTGFGVTAQEPGIFSNPDGEVMRQVGETHEVMVERQPDLGKRQDIYGMEGALGAATMGASITGGNENPVVMEKVTGAQVENRQTEDFIPEGAKDGERIERKWVETTEQVAKKYRRVPSKLLPVFARIRESYMRERFNRIIGGHN